MDGAAKLLRRKTLPAAFDHKFLDGGERGRVGRRRILRNVYRIGLVPDGRRHGAGRHDDDVDAEDHQFAAQSLRESFQPEFRGVVRPDERRSVFAADGRDHDDAPRLRATRFAGRARLATVCHQQRREGLGHDQLAGDIGFDLAAELVHVEIEQRPRHGDAGIVDQAEQGLSAKRRVHLLRRLVHRLGVGDVEDQRREIRPELFFQPVGVGLFAHTAEDPEALFDEDLDGSPADAGGRPRDDDAFHVPNPHSGACALLPR